MAQEHINIGTAPNDGTGDTLRESQRKAEANFTELYINSGGTTPTLAQVLLQGNQSDSDIILNGTGANTASHNGNESSWDDGTGFVAIQSDKIRLATNYIEVTIDSDNVTASYAVSYPDGKTGVQTPAFISDIPESQSFAQLLQADPSTGGYDIKSVDGNSKIRAIDGVAELAHGSTDQKRIGLSNGGFYLISDEIIEITAPNLLLNGSSFLTAIAGTTDEITVDTTNPTPIIGISANYTATRDDVANSKVQNSLAPSTQIAPSATAVIDGFVRKGVENTTTVILTSASLTSTYPTATTGFIVYCTGIIAGKMIYEKTPSGWVGYTVMIP